MGARKVPEGHIAILNSNLFTKVRREVTGNKQERRALNENESKSDPMRGSDGRIHYFLQFNNDGYTCRM